MDRRYRPSGASAPRLASRQVVEQPLPRARGRLRVGPLRTAQRWLAVTAMRASWLGASVASGPGEPSIPTGAGGPGRGALPASAGAVGGDRAPAVAAATRRSRQLRASGAAWRNAPPQDFGVHHCQIEKSPDAARGAVDGVAGEAEASAGVHLAGDMLAALARGDEAEALRLVNVADEVSARYAAAYLTRALLDTMIELAGDEARGRAAAQNMGEGIAADAVETAARVVLLHAEDDLEEDGPG